MLPLLALLSLAPPLAMIELAARAGARERRAREERERAYEAQRTFAANAAHEIRTPLAALDGNLAYLRGAVLPFECKLFARACTPEHPVGPCMVSSEGSCAAYYRYRRHEK